MLADQIYCARDNRKYLKDLEIELKAKPLGRPRKEALSNQVSPGERNPIEGKFGQAKTAYGLDRVKARLFNTSESWVATIILVLNLVKLAELVQYCLKFSKWTLNFFLNKIEEYLFEIEYRNLKNTKGLTLSADTK